jgi:NDP-sugar pyrophosphorylase family protein
LPWIVPQTSEEEDRQGYVTRPKPFVRVLGKEMLLWLIDRLNLGPEDHLVICFNPAYLCTGELMRRFVQDQYPNVILVELKGDTRGAAETVMIALEALPAHLKTR